jgi:hypothetical protein
LAGGFIPIARIFPGREIGERAGRTANPVDFLV